mmetsp:Transcript_26524/g.37255  ORF Transcript_26524/g.37255 Transcript_26524/m.37255 type:complete len:167 (-) Transcript_26524:1683-2183(-)
MENNLTPFLLLGGFNAAELWPILNLVVISWLLMAFAPRWKYTPSIVLIPCLIHSFIYSAGLLSMVLFGNVNGSFSSLEGIVSLFHDPNVVFIGWVHYLAFDALIGRLILLDSLERGTSIAVHFYVVVPILFATLMAGPLGWMLYQLACAVSLLPPRISGDQKCKDQ